MEVIVTSQIEKVVVLVHSSLYRLINVVNETEVVWVEFPIHQILPGEVGREGAQPQFVADGDHGELHGGGEHHVGHRGGDVLGGALPHLVDDGTHTETLGEKYLLREMFIKFSSAT